MRKILGLTGQAGSGKDYVYEMLRGEDPETRRIAFADGVRLEIEDVLAVGTRPLPFDYADAEGRLPAVWKKPYPPEVRALLQWWGTDFRRAQDPDYWVKKTIERVQDFPGSGLLCVTDVRFRNEASAIRALGGVVVQVWADEEVREERLGQLPPAHASEDIDFAADYFIKNNDETVFSRGLQEYLSR